KPGVKVKTIAREIERTIVGFGYKPISNLTGHLLKRYILHGGKNIPNVYGEYPWIIEGGEIYAIEPFATNGFGSVIETNTTVIYSLAKIKSGKTKLEKDMLKYIYTNFRMLPFCERWIMRSELGLSQETIHTIVNRLLEEGILTKYPVLREVRNGIVTQAETTIIITRDNIINIMENK
ncbi:MAG: M24 family metallopeptidase, partial [Candidatus Methanomethylicia archaeon]